MAFGNFLQNFGNRIPIVNRLIETDEEKRRKGDQARQRVVSNSPKPSISVAKPVDPGQGYVDKPRPQPRITKVAPAAPRVRITDMLGNTLSNTPNSNRYIQKGVEPGDSVARRIPGILVDSFIQPINRGSAMIQESPVGRLFGPSLSSEVERLAARTKDPRLAAAIRTAGYQNILDQAGIGINDSKATIGRKAVSNIGGTAANFIPIGLTAKVASGAARPTAGAVAKLAAQSGAAGALGSGLATAGSTDDWREIARSAAIGAGIGAALPVAATGAKVGIKSVNKNSVFSRLANETNPAKVATTLQKQGFIFDNIDEVAQAIARAANENEVLNILTNPTDVAAGTTAAVVGRELFEQATTPKVVKPKKNEPQVRDLNIEYPGMERVIPPGGRQPKTVPQNPNEIPLNVPQGAASSAVKNLPKPVAKDLATHLSGGKLTPKSLTEVNTALDKAGLEATVDNGVPTIRAKTPEPVQLPKNDISPELANLPPAQREELNKVAQQLGVKDVDELVKTVNQPQSSDISAVTHDDLSGRLAAQAEEVKKANKPRGIWAKTKAAWDPRNRAVEIDRKFAKSQGKKINDVDATQKLDSALEEAQQAQHIAYEYLKDSDIGKVIGKYGAKGSKAEDFNTYRIFKRDLEQRAAGRPAIVRDVSDTEMAQWVQQYEARNPAAESDLRQLVRDIEAVQDLAVNSDGRFLSPEDLQAARSKPDGGRYKFFTPVQRAIDEGLERPIINASNVGTLGRQKVLQEFTGSDIPIDPTFNALTDYVETVYRQLGQSRAVKLYSERTQEGLTGGKVIRSGDESARLKQMQDTFRELGDIQKTLGYQKVRVSFKAGAAKREANNAQRVASNRGRELLRQTVDDEDARAVISEMSDKELNDVLKLANEPDINSTPNVKRIYRSLIKKSEAHRKLAERLQDIKMDMESIKNARQGLGREMVELRLDTRGRQVIAGLDENGNSFKIEVPPEDAVMLQGLDKETMNGSLRAIHAAQTPFRQAFTGVFNPGFQVAQTTFNAVMAPFVSRRGIKIYSPDSLMAAVKSLSGRDEFTKNIRAKGAIRYGGGFEQLAKDSTADALASMGDTWSRTKWFADPRRGWKAIESLGGKLDQMARTAAAKAEYRAVLKSGLDENAALSSARYAYNNVLPNFRNLSSLVRGIDSIAMYAGASQAGTRTLLRSFRNDPVRQAARLSTLGVSIAGVAGYNMAQDKGEEFYDDMRKSGRGYILDNNVVVVTPGASKDKVTGKWSGVFMVPVPPEMRPLNRSIQKAVYDGQPGVPTKDFGLALFDFITGQSRTLSNPAVQLGSSLATGKDMHTGRQILDETMTPQEKRSARIDFTLNSFGVIGQSIAEGDSGKFFGAVEKRFLNPKGLSEGAEFYKNQDRIIKEVGLDKNELDAYRGTIAPTKKDLAGKEIKEKTYYDSANKATTWLRYPKTFEVAKRLDAENRKKGEGGDPLFDLKPDQQKLILTMMSNNSPGNYEEKAINKLNPWIKDFYKKRSDFFDQLNEKSKARIGQLEARPDAKTKPIAEKIKALKNEAAGYGLDPMGMKVPKADDALQAKLDEYSNITDGKQKHQYSVDNPEVADYFTAQNDYKRAKRAFLGLPQFDDYPKPSPEVQKLMDEYNKLPKGNGKKKRDGTFSSPDRSAWIKAHPNEWAAITGAFDKIAAWNAADEGALAVYEGLNEEGNLDGTPLSKTGGGSGFAPWDFEKKGSSIQAPNITNLLGRGEGGAPFSEAPKVKLRDFTTVQPPKASTPRKINISSLILPTKAPTLGTRKRRK